MPLSYSELCDLVERGVITDVTPERINPASIDVRLDAVILSESRTGKAGLVRPLERRGPGLERIEISATGYALHPGEWCLAATREKFSLPNDIAAEFRLKSSGARCGLDQALAVWCDPGWHGSALTIELRNVLQNHCILLEADMPIGQMVFHRVSPVPDGRCYRTVGRYNNDTEARGVKP